MAALTFGPLSVTEVAGLFAAERDVHDNCVKAVFGSYLFLPKVVALGKFIWTARLAEMSEDERELLLQDMTLACDVAQQALADPVPVYRVGLVGREGSLVTLVIGGGRLVMTPVAPVSWCVGVAVADTDVTKTLNGFLPEQPDDVLVVMERVAGGETASYVWHNGHAEERTGDDWSTPTAIAWSSFVDHVVAGSSW